jgi:hypothetical protein
VKFLRAGGGLLFVHKKRIVRANENPKFPHCEPRFYVAWQSRLSTRCPAPFTSLDCRAAALLRMRIFRVLNTTEFTKKQVLILLRKAVQAGFFGMTK